MMMRIIMASYFNTLGVLIFLVTANPVNAEDFDSLCRKFDHGSILVGRIADVDVYTREELGSVPISFDRGYLYQPNFSSKFADTRNMLFSIDYSDASPVGNRHREVFVFEDTFLTMLVSGRNSIIPMNGILLSAAGAPLNTSFEGSFTDTSQDFFGYSLLDIHDDFYTQPNNGGPRREIYAIFDENHEILEVMKCIAEGKSKTQAVKCNLRPRIFM